MAETFDVSTSFRGLDQAYLLCNMNLYATHSNSFCRRSSTILIYVTYILNSNQMNLFVENVGLCVK